MRAPTVIVRYLLLVLPAIFLLTAGVRLYALLHERSDIWWTPRSMLVPLARSHDRVAIYVRAGELDDLAAAGQLRLLSDSTRAVSVADIRLRFNNWDRVRAERLPTLVVLGATAGAAAALLLVGLVLTLAGGRAGTSSVPGSA